MKIYKSKNGYYYKEYKNGKKKRISNEEYKKNVNKLKGGSTGNSNKLITQLVGLKKKINKINELSKRQKNLKELPNNLPNNLNTVQNRLLLAMIANHHKYKRNSSGPTINISQNILEMIASELSSVDLKIKRLFSQAKNYIAMIKGVTVIDNGINYTKLENIQGFYNQMIKEHFPQIQENNFADSFNIDRSLYFAVDDYCHDEFEAIEKYGPIELWDVSKIKLMSKVFNGKKDFNADIGGWDVSNVTDMSFMFKDAVSFNRDISGWNVSSAHQMESMFMNATSFNQDISGWDLSRLTNIMKMFENCPIREKFKCKPK